VALPLVLYASCSSPKGSSDAGPDVVQRPEAGACSRSSPGDAASNFCGLPGSVVFGSDGSRCVVSGGPSAPSLTWLTLPDGFCAHYFAHVTTARQIRFAPGGELFVASPSNFTAGGAPAGLGAIIVLSDHDADGFADGDSLPHADGSAQSLTVFTKVVSVQGLMFAPGAFYFQDGISIEKLPYASGQTAAKGKAEQVIQVTVYESQDHWPKTLDMADDGTIFVGNGGDQSEVCNSDVFPRPFHGGILKVDGTAGGAEVAHGLRNPIAVRCQKGHDRCFAAELGLDGSEGSGGREKIVPIRQGDDWGYPCCATANLPYDEVSGSPNCSDVPSEDVALVIGNTPFGLDFEPGVWPAPYTSNMLVALHGEVATWTGARVLAVPTDATSGMPVDSSDLDSGNIPDFATGWDDGTRSHGRPAAITFSSDGRVFIANDMTGDIFWVAPVGAAPSH
jgi:glucose/arabinose dehydrogenase